MDYCFRIIVFSTDFNALKKFIGRKSFVFALLKISNPFLYSYIFLLQAMNKINNRHTIFPLTNVGRQISIALKHCVALPLDQNKRRSSNVPCNYKCDAQYISGHELTVTKLKFIWSKYRNNELMKITSSSEIYKTKY